LPHLGGQGCLSFAGETVEDALGLGQGSDGLAQLIGECERLAVQREGFG
jgi:hypothetical protein